MNRVHSVAQGGSSIPTEQAADRWADLERLMIAAQRRAEDGWRLMPSVPTTEMTEALERCESYCDSCHGTAFSGWSGYEAMWKAAERETLNPATVLALIAAARSGDLVAALDKASLAIQRLHTDVEALMADSEGVYGLHANGDPAPWDELREGGQLEDWLGTPLWSARNAWHDARAALAKYATQQGQNHIADAGKIVGLLTPERITALKSGDVLVLKGGRHMTRGGQTSYPDREVVVKEVTATHIKFADGSGWALSNGLESLVTPIEGEGA